MRSLLRLWLVAGFLAGAATAFGDASAAMSVQVKNGQLRATPSFMGQLVGAVAYGARVEIVWRMGETERARIRANVCQLSVEAANG